MPKTSLASRLFGPSVQFAQKVIANSRLGVWCTLRIGNQCRAILARAHGSTVIQMELNGEEALIQKVGASLKTAVDVGANKGDWTQMFLANTKAERCLLIEPASSALTTLRRRLGADARITILDAAAGDTVGRMAFYEEEDAGETSSLVAGTSIGGKARDVRVTTIDAEIEKLGWPKVDYLKIDAEGYDFHVLRGAQHVLEQKRVGLGQFEYNMQWAASGTTLAYALRWLSNLGYQCFLLKRKRLYVPQPEVYGEYFGYSNYVFCHAGTKQMIESLVRGTI